MTRFDVARTKIVHVIDLLRSSGGLNFDAEIESAADQAAPDLYPMAINISGEDAALFVRNNGELLKAVHLLVAAALDLHGEEHELLYFDVNHLRANYQAHMQRLANDAVVHVRSTSHSYSFDPMPSCERHMLHLALASSGLNYASRGEGPDRCVVVYPDAVSFQETGAAQRHASEHGHLREAS